MYYILNAWESIKRFAVKRLGRWITDPEDDKIGKKNPDKKEVGGWLIQRFLNFFP